MVPGGSVRARQAGGIAGADVAHVEEVALRVERADLQHRRLQPGLDPRHLPGEGRHHEGVGLAAARCG